MQSLHSVNLTTAFSFFGKGALRGTHLYGACHLTAWDQ